VDVDAQAVPTVSAVPFLDLGRTHAPLKERILGDVADLIDTGAFTNGPPVAAFEDAFAEFCGREHCVGVASGLDALRLALVAAGLEPGDEVIVPAATFVATLEAVTQAGGVPVVADASEADYGLAAPAADAAVTARTRFVMPVHLYGQLADPIALRSVAERHGLAIVEDACQAHGAERDGFRAGGLGLAAAFSFYPGKNLGAFGDAGALVCDDAGLAAAVRALREHGQAQKYRHVREGYTSRLDTIQAIVLAHKLPLLAAWNDERRAAAAAYDAALAGVGDLVLPPVPRGSDPVWHLYVVRSARRDDLAAFLRARGIATGLHYPEPPHLSAAYAYLGHGRGSFPVAERLADEALSLPMFPGIRSEEVAAVADAVAAFFRRG
jgi:dTDP-4-amino-4,6-dideoxygalactose transaminase